MVITGSKKKETWRSLRPSRLIGLRRDGFRRTDGLLARRPVEERETSRSESDNEHGNPDEEPADQWEKGRQFKDDRAAHDVWDNESMNSSKFSNSRASSIIWIVAAGLAIIFGGVLLSL